MTEGTSPAGHPDDETLALSQEGLLAAEAELSVRGHLAGCATCAARRDALAAVSGRLAAAADAGPVPADVAARLDHALAAAAAPALPSVPDRGPRGMRVLQAAAVVVLLLAGIGVVASVLQVGGRDSDNATTAGGAVDSAPKAAESGGFPVTASGRNWAPDTVVAAIPELVTGALGPSVMSDTGDTGDSGGAGGATGGEEEARTLRGAPGDTARLASGPALAECVGALNDGPVTPVAVDLASWQGNPAVVIVLPTPGDPASVDAWVVGPECAQADAQVLYFARAPRP